MKPLTLTIALSLSLLAGCEKKQAGPDFTDSFMLNLAWEGIEAERAMMENSWGRYADFNIPRLNPYDYTLDITNGKAEVKVEPEWNAWTGAIDLSELESHKITFGDALDEMLELEEGLRYEFSGKTKTITVVRECGDWVVEIKEETK